jgi:hypothetical protein
LDNPGAWLLFAYLVSILRIPPTTERDDHERNAGQSINECGSRTQLQTTSDGYEEENEQAGYESVILESLLHNSSIASSKPTDDSFFSLPRLADLSRASSTCSSLSLHP